MIKKLSVIGFVAILMLFSSCDKVGNPFIVQTTLDTTLYPGNFNTEYVFPDFPQNTNTLRNFLIEDYTGHKCSFCPGAATVAAQLETDNPGRVFVATIHGGAASNGISPFQEFDPQASKYYTDFTNPEGLEMAGTFFDANVGFNSNPKGTVNRIPGSAAQIFISASDWASETALDLALPLDANLQAESNYYSETNAVFLHVETEFLNDLNGEYNIVVYCIEKSVTDWQLVQGTGDVSDYKHHNIHIGNVYDETWGRTVATGEVAAGTKVLNDFSYELPVGMTPDNMHFQIFVYDKATYEILQVIEHDF